MPFPKTRAEMIAAGYALKNSAACRSCRLLIEFWATPQQKHLPMEPMPTDDSPAISHWATCPDAAKFRKKKRA